MFQTVFELQRVSSDATFSEHHSDEWFQSALLLTAQACQKTSQHLTWNCLFQHPLTATSYSRCYVSKNNNKKNILQDETGSSRRSSNTSLKLLLVVSNIRCQICNIWRIWQRKPVKMFHFISLNSQKYHPLCFCLLLLVIVHSVPGRERIQGKLSGICVTFTAALENIIGFRVSLQTDQFMDAVERGPVIKELKAPGKGCDSGNRWMTFMIQSLFSSEPRTRLTELSLLEPSCLAKWSNWKDKVGSRRDNDAAFSFSKTSGCQRGLCVEERGGRVSLIQPKPSNTGEKHERKTFSWR